MGNKAVPGHWKPKEDEAETRLTGLRAEARSMPIKLSLKIAQAFNDGNGRMSRLLTTLLRYRAGYAVGKYAL